MTQLRSLIGSIRYYSVNPTFYSTMKAPRLHPRRQCPASGPTEAPNFSAHRCNCQVNNDHHMRNGSAHPKRPRGNVQARPHLGPRRRRHRRRGRSIGYRVLQGRQSFNILHYVLCYRASIAEAGMYSHCKTGGWILGNTIDGL